FSVRKYFVKFIRLNEVYLSLHAKVFLENYALDEVYFFQSMDVLCRVIISRAKIASPSYEAHGSQEGEAFCIPSLPLRFLRSKVCISSRCSSTHWYRSCSLVFSQRLSSGLGFDFPIFEVSIMRPSAPKRSVLLSVIRRNLLTNGCVVCVFLA